MLADRGRELKDAVKEKLVGTVVEDGGLPKNVPWGPHLWVRKTNHAWHLLTALPDSDAWARRMRLAKRVVPKLRLGIAAPVDVLRNPNVLLLIDELECAVVVVDEHATGYRASDVRESICDVIYEWRIVLEPTVAETILDRCLDRALKSRGSYEKGAILELLTAVLLSQVKGFEVTDRNILSMNQEVDVHVTNRNSSGPLGRGQYVLAESKNWKAPVPRREYDAFVRKMRTRRGMAKLGLMVTTSTFEDGVYVEAIRDSERDDLVVLLDKDRLPSIWRGHNDVTHGLEVAINNAVYDHMPR